MNKLLESYLRLQGHLLQGRLEAQLNLWKWKIWSFYELLLLCFFSCIFLGCRFQSDPLGPKRWSFGGTTWKAQLWWPQAKWRTSWECVLQSWENCQWKQESLQRQNLKKAEDDKMLALERYFTSSRKKLTECILQEHLQGPVSAVPSAED